MPGPGRSCGDCQACCTVIQVTELKKPLWTRCDNQCDTGCGIYEDRPESCAGFECLWLQGSLERDGTVKETYRPDRLGVIFDHQPKSPLGKVIKVFEVWDGGSNSTRVRKMIDKLATAWIVVVFREDTRVVKGPPHLLARVSKIIKQDNGDIAIAVKGKR